MNGKGKVRIPKNDIEPKDNCFVFKKIYGFLKELEIIDLSVYF
jgi:hypothetical protein